MKELILLLLWTALVFIEALTDANGDKGRKGKQHFLQALFIAGYFLGMASVSYWEVSFINFIWFYVCLYIATRLFWFDIFYNTIIGNPAFYIGKVAGFDKFLRWTRASEFMIRWTFLCIYLGATIGIIYNFKL